ncbi:MAG: serine hydrolase [Pseudomonadota bacterium]
MFKYIGYGVAGLAVLAAGGWWAIGPDYRAALTDIPQGESVFTFTQSQRDTAFRMMDRAPWIITSRPIEASGETDLLPDGEPLDLNIDIDAYVEEQRAAAVVVVHNGKVRLEEYGLGFEAGKRWTSFSVAKSITSTMIGAAIKDGYITSTSDPVTKYIPDFEGTAYDGVTLEQILKMTSGVEWNEDYDDPTSDVGVYSAHVPEGDIPAIVSYMRNLDRRYEPGEQFYYNSGETGLIGIIVTRAVGKPLAEYVSETLWQPFGMEQKGSWLLGEDGEEISGCCVQATPRDFARFGLFVLNEINGTPSGELPDGWFDTAGAELIEGAGSSGWGYGYQWWILGDGAFMAVGIYGQSILIDPKRDLVIASNSSWTSPLGGKDGEFFSRNEFWKTVQAAIDRENAPGEQS